MANYLNDRWINENFKMSKVLFNMDTKEFLYVSKGVCTLDHSHEKGGCVFRPSEGVVYRIIGAVKNRPVFGWTFIPIPPDANLCIPQDRFAKWFYDLLECKRTRYAIGQFKYDGSKAAGSAWSTSSRLQWKTKTCPNPGKPKARHERHGTASRPTTRTNPRRARGRGTVDRSPTQEALPLAHPPGQVGHQEDREEAVSHGCHQQRRNPQNPVRH